MFKDTHCRYTSTTRLALSSPLPSSHFNFAFVFVISFYLFFLGVFKIGQENPLGFLEKKKRKKVRKWEEKYFRTTPTPCLPLLWFMFILTKMHPHNGFELFWSKKTENPPCILLFLSMVGLRWWCWWQWQWQQRRRQPLQTCRLKMLRAAGVDAWKREMEVEMRLSTHGMHKVFDSISEDCSGYCRNPILQVMSLRLQLFYFFGF